MSDQPAAVICSVCQHPCTATRIRDDAACVRCTYCHQLYAYEQQVWQMIQPNTAASGAWFSKCRRWRWLLWRCWEPTAPKMLIIGLNPSTANEHKPDPTITRCIGFARREGCGTYLMGNLAGWRSTKPTGLKTPADPVGADNLAYIAHAAARADKIVVAWGSNHWQPAWVNAVLDILPQPLCFGTNANGAPKHPLYLRADTPLVPYERPT